MRTSLSTDMLRSPLQSLELVDHCQMCGRVHEARLEAAFDPGGEAKTLCWECRMGSAELLWAERGNLQEALDMIRDAIARVRGTKP